jgi:hypothetical protein
MRSIPVRFFQRESQNPAMHLMFRTMVPQAFLRFFMPTGAAYEVGNQTRLDRRWPAALVIYCLFKIISAKYFLEFLIF